MPGGLRPVPSRCRIQSCQLWGIAHLADRRPRQIVNAAYSQTLEDGLYTYRHVKVIAAQCLAQALQQLQKGRAGVLGVRLTQTQAHDLVRGHEEYGELFAKAAAPAAATRAYTSL